MRYEQKHNMMHIVSWLWLNITFGKNILILIILNLLTMQYKYCKKL
jgi:hypothetical protein